MRVSRLLGAVVLAACGLQAAWADSDATPAGVAAGDADPAVLFERGRVDAQAGRHEAAVRAFEQLLARTDSPRVRLEMARSLAALGRRDEALAAYRAVQAAQPPEPVAGWVASEMAALAPASEPVVSAGWSWHPRAGLGAIADSNVNAGPTDANVQIFGLPFELSAASLAQHDVGAQAWLGVGAERDGAWGRWHADARWSGTRYRRLGEFGADALSVAAGLARGDAGRSLDVSVAAETQVQRNGNGRDAVTLGAQGLHEVTAAGALAWLAAAGHVHQHQVAGADGGFGLGGVSLNLRRVRADGDAAWLPARVEALLGVRVLRESLQDGDRSHTDVTPQVALQSTTALCEGCTLTLDLARTAAGYDAVDPAFGARRHDRLRVLTFTLAHSAPAGADGATWQCAVERSVNASTLAAWRYDRTVLRCSREWQL